MSLLSHARQPLRELQRDLQRYLAGECAAVSAAIVDAPPLPARERLAIYRNAHQARLIDALNDTYPKLHGLLGDEMFVALGEQYLAAHPSVHRSLRWFGGELADTLGELAPYNDVPLLAEMAVLEWTLAGVFDAADADTPPRSALARIEPGAWSGLTFEFHPSLRRLTLSWNTASVWRAMSNDETPPQPERGAAPVPWVLWRQNLQNYFRSLSAAEACALDAAMQGRCFGEICTALCSLMPQHEVPAAAAALLAGWTDAGLIVNVRA